MPKGKPASGKRAEGGGRPKLPSNLKSDKTPHSYRVSKYEDTQIKKFILHLRSASEPSDFD